MRSSSSSSSIITGFCFIAIFFSISAASSSGAGYYYEGSQLGLGLPTRSACRGTVAECLSKAEEFELDSEYSRRVLATTRKYISYGALQRNTVPCSRRGQSYYNCKAGGPVNSYTRGCSAITRCRS